MQKILIRVAAAVTLLLVGVSARAAHINIAAAGGVGAVNVVDDDQCSLREAMLLANGATVNDDCIAVADSASLLTLNLSVGATYSVADGPYAIFDQSGLPVVTGDYAIEGHGASIVRVGLGWFRLLLVDTTGVLSLHDLTIGNGYTPNNGCGGGVQNLGSLTISDSTLRGNSAGANSGATGGDGGGICNHGTLDMVDTVVSDNTASNGGGGILNVGTLTISGSIIRGNSSGTGTTGAGGGISNFGDLTLSTSTVEDNTTTAFGGGVSSEGSATIRSSTLVGNSSGAFGGGLAALAGSFSVANTTVTGSLSGGGVAAMATPGHSVDLTISYSTISGNAVSGPFGAGVFATTFDATGVTTVTLDHAIIDRDVGAACFTSGPASIVSNGYNLARDASCGLAAVGDLPNTDPQLGPLANHGGPTSTLLPSPGSPAVDAIPVAGCALGVPGDVDVDSDQRGRSRPSAAGCDMGAVELQRPLDRIFGDGFDGVALPM